MEPWDVAREHESAEAGFSDLPPRRGAPRRMGGRDAETLDRILGA